MKMKKVTEGVQKITVFWSVKFHKELLHAIVDHLHLVITHHPDSYQSNTPDEKR